MDEQYGHLKPRDEVFNSTPNDSKNDFLGYIVHKETAFEILDENKISNISNSKEEFFNGININSEKYKFILATCFSTAKFSGRISISLNIPFKDKYKYVLAFLMYIKMGLPKDVMKLLCFTMENSEVIITKSNLISDENNKESNIISRTKDIFTFDFVSGKFQIHDLKIDLHGYLDFIWDNLNFNEKLIRFKSMAQTLSKDKLILDEYDKLCTLFSVNENRLLLNESERIEALKSIYNSIINTNNSTRNKYLCNLFINILQVEFNNKKLKRREYLPSSDLIEVILNFYDLIESYFDEIKGENIKKIINAYILLSIVDGKESGKLVYVSNIFLNANTKTVMFRNLIDNMFVHEQFVEEILNWYILKRFAEVSSLDKLLELINFWGRISPKVIQLDFFIEYVESKLLSILREEYTKIPICIKVYNFLDEFKDLCNLEEDKEKYIIFAEKVRKSIHSYMTEAIDLARITCKDLMDIEIKSIDENNNKYKSIYYVQKFLKGHKDIDIREIEIHLCSLDRYIMLNLTHLIKEYYEKSIIKCNFRNIMVGFVDQAVYVNNIVLYNFYDLFKYINKNNGIEETREYIAWISDDFTDLKDSMLLSRFKSDLWLYLESFDKYCFKDRKANKLFSQIKNENIKKILQDIKNRYSVGLKGIVFKLAKNDKKYY